MDEDPRRGGRRSTGDRNKAHSLLTNLESIRALIRSISIDKLEVALKVLQLDEIFEQIETAEGKPTILHQVVHSAQTLPDFEALIDCILRVVFEKQPDLRASATPLANWANAMDAQGHAPVHKAVSMLGGRPRKANREPLHCLHVLRRLVQLGAVLWLQSSEGRTAFEYLLDNGERYVENDSDSKQLLDFFIGQIELGQSGLMENEFARILKACARHGFHTPLRSLIHHSPQAAEECFTIACQEGQLGCVEVLLLAAQSVPEMKLTKQVITIGLQEACKNNKKDIVARLINEGDAPSSQGWGCLQLACASGHADVVQLLLSRNAKAVIAPNSPHPLHLAARNGNVNVISLLATSLSGDVPDADGRTALHYATAAMCIPPEPGVEWRAAETFLLRSINVIDDEGLTPLSYSLRQWAELEGGKPDSTAMLRTVKYLLTKGADVHIKGEPKRASVSEPATAVELVQERCNAFPQELLVQIWKASPSAPPKIVSRLPTPTPAAVVSPRDQKPTTNTKRLLSDDDIVTVESKRIGISATSPSPPSLLRPPSQSYSPSPVPAAAAAMSPSSIRAYAHHPPPVAMYNTLRFTDIVRDDTGAIILPPEFLVSGSPDGSMHMSLVEVPATHKHTAIAVAAKLGKLDDGQKRELYEIWATANQR